MQPVSTCRSASLYKISLKSDNRSMNYGQKTDFKDGGRRHLEIAWVSHWTTHEAAFVVRTSCKNFV